MSDNKPLTILDFISLSDRQVIQSVIAESIICDYGIVRKVTDNKVVDVEHASRRVLMGGIQSQPIIQDARITYDIELLFPSSSGMAQSWTVDVGDGVLLVGLQNVVPSTQGLTQSSAPAEFWHYAAQTLKAIPLSAIRTDALVQFGEDGGKAFLRNGASSLFTILDTLNTDLKNFATTTSSATTAPQIAVAAATLLTALNTLTTAISGLLEA